MKTNTAAKQEDCRSLEQAKAQFESIKTMVERLDHCEECDGSNCTLNDGTIKDGIGLYHKDGEPTHGQPATLEQREEYHDADKARQAIEEDPLSLQVRSDWHTLGDADGNKPGEYNLLLCTGGPACRIVGDLNEHGEVLSARIEHQDWGTPWTEYRLDSEEEEIVKRYVGCFYFGE